MKGCISRRIFILVFFLTLVYPIAGLYLDTKLSLSGVTGSSSLTELNVSNIMDGSFQTSLNTWVENNFPGRNLLIKLRSQMRYSLLNESANSNVEIGKDKYLFEPHYIARELGVQAVNDEGYFKDTINKLEQLQMLLAEKGKELFLFITPNKAHFFEDKIPDYYFALDRADKNDYTVFVEHLQGSDLKYFDSRTFIENYDGPQLDAPVYYPTGVHWSHPWGATVAAAFSEFISSNSKWELSTLAVTEIATEGPNLPDTDVYDTLNLLIKPSNVQFYTSATKIVEEKDKPNVVIRGGSFLGQSLSNLSFAGVFNKDLYMENSTYTTNGFSTFNSMSSFSAYDEVTVLSEFLSEADILILEVQEANIYNMSFGFIDYLLEHPEYLEYPER